MKLTICTEHTEGPRGGVVTRYAVWTTYADGSMGRRLRDTFFTQAEAREFIASIAEGTSLNELVA